MDRLYLSDYIVRYHFPVKKKEEYRFLYEKNQQALEKYRFLLGVKLPAFKNLSIHPVPMKKGYYSFYDSGKNRWSETYQIQRTNKIQHPFFLDLEKPLLIRNELNRYHWEYLYDNVRKSEDYGDDNHVYMYYDSFDVFLLFLQLEDITNCLEMEKFVFLFGERSLEKNYPLDFSEYGINYNGMECKPIRIEEIKRVFANLGLFPSAGNDFTYGIFDYHKNLLTMGQRGIPDYTILYKIYFSKKNISEFESDYLNQNMEPLVYKAISIMLGDTEPVATVMERKSDPDIKKFFSSMHELWPSVDIPSQEEWIRLLYLAYSNAMDREFHGRIAPAIMFNTHWNVKFPGENVWDYNYDFFKGFKYYLMILPFRHPIVSAASITRVYEKAKSFVDETFINRMINWAILGHYLETREFLKKGDPRLEFLKMVRLEDLKLHTKAMLQSLCEYFDIEWDENLLRVTYNNVDVTFDGTSGYDPAPVYKRYYEICNPFDYYRLEIVMSKYWRHWGYEPFFYKDNITYTNEEILKMYEISFQCETLHKTETAKKRNEAARKKMYKLVKKRLGENNAPLDENGEEMLPVPWLKPKEELLEGE